MEAESHAQRENSPLTSHRPNPSCGSYSPLQAFLESGLKQSGPLAAKLSVANQLVSEGNNFTSHTTIGSRHFRLRLAPKSKFGGRSPAYLRRHATGEHSQTRLEQVAGARSLWPTATWVRLLVACRPCFAFSTLHSWWLKIVGPVTTGRYRCSNAKEAGIDRVVDGLLIPDSAGLARVALTTLQCLCVQAHHGSLVYRQQTQNVHGFDRLQISERRLRRDWAGSGRVSPVGCASARLRPHHLH